MTRRRLTLEDMHRVARSRGGQCLSSKYERDSAHLLWRCAERHAWTATYSNIRRGTWCPVCSRVPPDRRQRYTRLARAKAKVNGGTLLSEEVPRASAKIRWQCAKGHRWAATWLSVRRGSWCPRCYGRVRFTLADAQALARSLGGVCLSKRYVDSRTPLRWRSADGHEWRASIQSVKRGGWGRSASVPERDSLAAMRELARQRGGSCLSRRYEGARTLLT